MEVERDDIVRVDLVDNAIFNRVIVLLFGVRAEHTVKNNQHTAVVAIDIFGVAAVVNAVGAGRVKPKLQPGVQLANRLGVNEILVKQVHRVQGKHNAWVHT